MVKLSSLEKLPVELHILISENLDDKLLSALHRSSRTLKAIYDQPLSNRGLLCAHNNRSTYIQNLTRFLALGAYVDYDGPFSRSDGTTIAYAGITALDLAVRFRNTEAAELLLENGACPNLSRSSKLSVQFVCPLVRAVREDNLPMVKLLVEHGADVRRPQSLLERCKSYAVLELLLQKGADPNAGVRCTPLHNAIAACNSVDMARLLLEHGARINDICCGCQTSALSLARREGRDDDMLALLESFGGEARPVSVLDQKKC